MQNLPQVLKRLAISYIYITIPSGHSNAILIDPVNNQVLKSWNQVQEAPCFYHMRMIPQGPLNSKQVLDKLATDGILGNDHFFFLNQNGSNVKLNYPKQR